MAQEISKGSLFGRIGSGFAKGLAEQVPKEIERSRLSSGLKKLGENKDLDPWKQFSEFVSVPGVVDKPQLVETGGNLLRQRAYLNSLKNQYEGQGGPKAGGGSYIPTAEELNQPRRGEMPSLATPQATAESYKEFIPPTEQEERRDAYENFKQNPMRYDNNFDNALAERKSITSRNQEIQKAYQGTEATALGKESAVKTAFQNESNKLLLQGKRKGKESPIIPPETYQKYEQKAINAVLSKKEGGEGLTQEQAINKYSRELGQAFREYSDLGSISLASPIDSNRIIDALQPKFADRGDQKLMMDQLIADQGFSPTYAAHKTYPIKKGEMPLLKKFDISAPYTNPKLNDFTYQQLKKQMGKKNSPLSIAYELEQKGENPRGFLNYLKNNRDDLEVWQADQLSKNLNVINLKDAWFRAWE